MNVCKARGGRPDLLPCPPLLAWPAYSSLTGEMMSNWMGVSGATRESREREDRAGDSEPAELWLLERAALGRPCLEGVGMVCDYVRPCACTHVFE